MVEDDVDQAREPATEGPATEGPATEGPATVGPATADVEKTPPVRPVTRGGILAIWVILGMMFGAAVGTLIGLAVPGDFPIGGAIGLGVGVALGAAIGSRRADAKDREHAATAAARQRADEGIGEEPDASDRA